MGSSHPAVTLPRREHHEALVLLDNLDSLEPGLQHGHHRAVSQNGVFIVLTLSSYDSASVPHPLAYSRIGGASTTVDDKAPGGSSQPPSARPSGPASSAPPRCSAPHRRKNPRMASTPRRARQVGQRRSAGSGLMVDLAEAESSCSAARRVTSLTSEATRISARGGRGQAGGDDARAAGEIEADPTLEESPSAC